MHSARRPPRPARPTPPAPKPHSHSLTHIRSLTHSLTLTHTHSLTRTHSPAHSLSLSLTLSLTFTRSLTLTRSLSLTRSLTLTRSLSSLAHSLPHSLSHSLNDSKTVAGAGLVVGPRAFGTAALAWNGPRELEDHDANSVPFPSAPAAQNSRLPSQHEEQTMYISYEVCAERTVSDGACF